MTFISFNMLCQKKTLMRVKWYSHILVEQLQVIYIHHIRLCGHRTI